MPAQIFGTQATAVQLYVAFYGVSPSNPIYANYNATITASGTSSLATQIAAGFASVTDAALTTTVLTNMGITAATTNADAYAALSAAVIQVFAANPTARGQVVLNMVGLLVNLEGNSTYGTAAAAWNNTTLAAYTYASNTANTTTGSTATSTTGLNLTLTTGVDFATGTAGNDTIIGDNTGATKQLTVADSVNGGAGTDTLKVYLATTDTASGQPTLTAIENVFLNGGVVTAYTAATGTTGLTLENSNQASAAYTLAGQDLTLQNRTSLAANTLTIASAATSTATSQKITATAFTRDAAANVTTVDVTGGLVATLNLVGETTASNFNLANSTGAAIRTINYSGAVGLTTTLSAAMAAAVTTIDANTATGALSVSTANGTVAGAFKFTGGAGNDTVTFANDALGTLISGTQLNGGAGTDKLGTFDAAFTATEIARINQATNFETLGLNGAALTLDASSLTSIKAFSIDTTALTQSITTMATGSTVTITAAAPTSLTLGTAVGVTDVAIVLGSATSTGIAPAALVTTGITNVTVTSNGLAANSIATLTNSDNSVFTVKGGTALTLALNAGTAVGSKIDGSAATGILTLTGSSITTSGDIIIGGTANDIINGGKGADTLTGGAGADVFTFTSAAAANASGGTFGQADVITDFVVGTDKLQFSTADIVSAQQGAVQTAVSALAAGSSATAIATAMATASDTALGVSFAVFEGNTYVLYENATGTTGVAANDVFIKLTGIATLPTFAADVVA